MTQTVLILGASGKIGSHAAEAFWNAGWSVHRFDRKSGDMTKAAMGADVIVNGLNPPNYHNWAGLIPTITAQVIAAAKASGATVIIPGNVYNFGDINGVIDETTPQRPNSRKGAIRVAMERAYQDAGVRTIVLRAGNFIDPAQNGDVHSMLTLAKAKRGKITSLGNPAAMQAYAYLPDWARAAVALAEMRDSLAIFEDIPFPGHSFRLTDLREEVEAATGKKMRFARFPWLIMTLAAPIWELARELREMRYLTSMSHRLDSKKFDRLLPDFAPTDMRTAMFAGLPADIYPDQPVGTGGQTILAQ